MFQIIPSSTSTNTLTKDSFNFVARSALWFSRSVSDGRDISTRTRYAITT